MIRITSAALLASAASILFTRPALADHPASATGAQTSGPIIGASARTARQGEAAISFELTLAQPDSRSDAALADLANRHIHAHDQDRGELYTLGFAYGLTDDVTLSASLPLVRRVSIREGEHAHVGGVSVNDVAERGTSAGIGDASLVAKWRFTGENHHGLEAALLAGLKLPTGATDQIDDLGTRFETEHQPGSGSRDPLVGVAVTRSMDKGSVNASAIWQFATPGSQDTTLGDRAQLAIGLVRRLAGGRPAYHLHELAAGHDEARQGHVTLDGVFELHGEWEGRQRVGGVSDANSGGKALFVSPGLRLGLSRWSMTVGASIPLAQDIRLSHPEMRYRLRLGIARAL